MRSSNGYFHREKTFEWGEERQKVQWEIRGKVYARHTVR